MVKKPEVYEKGLIIFCPCCDAEFKIEIDVEKAIKDYFEKGQILKKVYDNNGKFILHEVSKEKPCWVCDATSNTAHTNYCPNSRYLDEVGRG